MGKSADKYQCLLNCNKMKIESIKDCQDCYFLDSGEIRSPRGKDPEPYCLKVGRKIKEIKFCRSGPLVQKVGK